MKYIYEYPSKDKLEINSKNKKQIIKGGTLSGEDRLNYLRLCFSLKKKKKHHRETVAQLLTYLANHVYSLFPTLPPYKQELFRKIFSIMTSPTPIDVLIDDIDENKNYLSIINLVSLQCTILLTDDSEEARRDPRFMLYIADPYNDPSKPPSKKEMEDELKEIDEFFEMSIEDLRTLSDEELDDLIDEKLDALEEEEYSELLDFYALAIDDEDTAYAELKALLKKRVTTTKSYTGNVFYTKPFDELLKCDWTDYRKLKKHIIETPMLFHLFSPLIYSKKGREYKYPLEKDTNIFLAVILGEMTLSEILVASSNRLFFIGVVSKDSIADGYNYNPFLFFYHDIDHAIGDIEDRYSTLDVDKVKSLNKKIIRFITLYDKKLAEGTITQEKYYNIMFWLFLLAHEFPAGVDLLFETERDVNNIFNSLLSRILFPIGNRYPYLFRFKNELDLGGLISPRYRKNILQIVESGKKPNPVNDLMADNYVPMFFKISVKDFAEAWFPQIKQSLKTRSVERSISKSKTRKSKTRKPNSI